MAGRFGERARVLLRRSAALPYWPYLTGHQWLSTKNSADGHGRLLSDQLTGPSVPDDARVQLVLDLAIRVGEVLLSSGEGVAATTAMMVRLADAGGLPACDVDITFTSITMCCHRGMVAPPVTTMRLVRYRSLDLTRLTDVERLVERVVNHECELVDAASELDQIIRARHPYPRWVATAAWAGMAASVAMLLGGGWVAAGVAFGSTGVIDRIGRVLNRWGMPIFFQQVAGAMLATGITSTLVYFAVFPANTKPSLVVAAALTVLLSGLSVVGAVRDSIDGFFLTAAGRAAEIAMYSAGLLGGVVLALKAAIHFGAEVAVASPLPTSTGSALLQMLAAGLTSGCFALAGYSPVRYLPAAAGTGAAGWGSYVLLHQLNFGPVVSTGIAAVALGVFAGVLNRYTEVPGLVITLAGITPLLPGLTAYRGFYQLAVTGVTDGLVTVTLAFAIGLALAGGVALGEWVTSRIHRRSADNLALVTGAQTGPGQ